MSTPSNTPSTYPVEREAVHADSFPDTLHIPTQRDWDSEDLPDTVTDEEDAFETDDEPMESDADDSFDEEDVSEEEEVMEDEGGSLGRRLGLFTCVEVARGRCYFGEWRGGGSCGGPLLFLFFRRERVGPHGGRGGHGGGAVWAGSGRKALGGPQQSESRV